MSAAPHRNAQAPPSKTRRFQRVFLFPVCAGCLSVLFGFQLLLLFSGSWKVPHFALAQLHEQLAEEGLRAEYDSVRFRFPGRVVVINLRVSRTSDEEPLLAAEAGQVQFSLPDLLAGDVKIGKVMLYGGALHCPAALSPTGGAEQILGQIHLTATQDRGAWTLHNLNGQIENLAFMASGSLPALPERRPSEPVAWEPIVENILPRVIREREHFERVENPRVRVRFSPDAEDRVLVETAVWADAVDATVGVRVVEPQIVARWSYGETGWRGEGASLGVSFIDLDGKFAVRNLAGSVDWPLVANPAPLIPDRARLSLGELATPAGTLTDIFVNLNSVTEAEVAADFFTLFEDDPLKGEARLNWKTGTGQVDVLSRINPTPFLQHDIARQLGLRRDVFFREPVLARAEANFERWRFAGASARALAREADIDGVFVNRAVARVELFPDRFIMPELVLAYDDFETTGSYEIDFNTREYRFLFNGDIRPLHISAWFNDWWVHLWEQFDFPESPLRGDVDIRSVLGDSKKVQLTGSIGADNFFLRGVPIQTLNTKILVLDSYADLYDTRITRLEGRAEGSFQYWADPATRDFAKVVFQVDSTINPTDVAQIFGDAGVGVLAPFRFTEPPFLSLEGVVYNEPRMWETRVDIIGRTDAPLEFHGLELDHLRVNGSVEGDAWILPELEAGFAGGEVVGHIKKWGEAEEDRLDIGLLMRALDIEAGRAALARWRAENGGEQEKHTPGGNISGILDMNLEGTGTYGDLQSFSGNGSLEIYDAYLTEVHLLGLLSRILTETPLGFTSLQFDQAAARFEVDLNKVHIPQFRLRSPTAALSGSGDYLIDQDALDFSVKLHLMQESRIPFLALLLSPVLEPLAHVMEIRLTGTTEDPQWRFLFGPRNILSGFSSSSQEEEPLTKPISKRNE